MTGTLWARPVLHRKITNAQLALLLDEARKRAALTLYKHLAEQTGLSYRSVQQVMHELIREERQRLKRVHRGTEQVQLDELLRGLQSA